MRQLHLIILSLLCTAGLCHSPSTGPLAYSIRVTNGPTVRIPGISPPTELTLTGARETFIRWTNENMNEVGRGATFQTTTPGTYHAWDVKVSSIPGEPDLESVTDAGAFTIPALSHFAESKSAAEVCLTSNAFTYATKIVWKRNGRVTRDGSVSCANVLLPGTYSATVTYSYGGQSATFEAPAAIVAPLPGTPVVSVETSFGKQVTSYNPVKPPRIVVVSAGYARYQLFKDDVIIVDQIGPPAVFPINTPGIYNFGAWRTILGNIAGFTNDIVLQKGDIPVPNIVSSNGGVLTYDHPTLQLTAEADHDPAIYGNGYTWYFNDQVIEGATASTLTISKTGNYSVKGCATYPDGSSQCQTSSPIQITGEIVHVNYVRMKLPLIENITSPSQLDALPPTQVNIATAYLDNFARPIEQVQQGASPLGGDIVSINEYDFMGRETRKFLPFVSAESGGTFLPLSPAHDLLTTFYQRDNDRVANTAFPYAETQYEASSLSRVLKQGNQGEEWQLSTGHVNSLSYANNKASDKVWIWAANSGGVSATKFYPDGSLVITQHTNEDGQVEREYKDKNNQVVLTEKVIEGDVKLRTYTVMDDMGRLSYVLPPKTVSALPDAATVTIPNDVLARECFSYRYDYRSRVIAKNMPGGGWQYIVYDKWDRVVLTQHANQRTRNKWSFNKYDQFNRVILNGEISLQTDLAGAIRADSLFYKDVHTNPALRYEQMGGSIHGYTNRSFPVLANESQVYQAMYYDNYDFLPQFSGGNYQFNPEPSLGLTANFPRVQSLVTGAKTVILGTNTYLKTVTYYDKKHRPIQVVSDNHLGGFDRVSNAYDFTGKVLKTKTNHQGLQSVTIDEENTYDPSHRLLKTYHTVAGGPRILLASHGYNELGQLVEKNIHSEDEETFLQSCDYTYNIRGWMEQMNPVETEENVSYPDLYRFGLSYTTNPGGLPDFQPSFSGNITAFSEARPSQTEDNGAEFKSVFSYRYDIRNQLTGASYYQPSDPLKNNAFDLPVISYDPNGNIKTLKRKGMIDGVPGLIDDLNYSYNGNQLIGVTDAADRTKGFIKK